MTDIGKTLSTTEFSKMTGISVATLGKMLRRGKLRGEKHNGKWAILASELQHVAVVPKKDPTPTSTKGSFASSTSPAAADTYDIETFVQMTYLTEKGVRQWLKTGRLSGGTDTGGKVLVDAANLDRPELRHLIRK